MLDWHSSEWPESQRWAELGTFTVRLFWWPHPFPMCPASLTQKAAQIVHVRIRHPHKASIHLTSTQIKKQNTTSADISLCHLLVLLAGRPVATTVIQRGIWKRTCRIRVSDLLGK